jgi:hypothetical protein
MKARYCFSVKTIGALPIGVADRKLKANMVSSGRKTASVSQPYVGMQQSRRRDP